MTNECEINVDRTGSCVYSLGVGACLALGRAADRRRSSAKRKKRRRCTQYTVETRQRPGRPTQMKYFSSIGQQLKAIGPASLGTARVEPPMCRWRWRCRALFMWSSNNNIHHNKQSTENPRLTIVVGARRLMAPSSARTSVSAPGRISIVLVSLSRSRSVSLPLFARSSIVYQQQFIPFFFPVAHAKQ